MTTDELATLTRKPDRAGDRRLLDEVLDEARVGVLSTVTDDRLPWSVPMLAARDGDRLLIHGSSGAGALRHVAAGAPVTFTAFLLDGLVVAETLFDHSVNYRSAVVRGRLQPVEKIGDTRSHHSLSKRWVREFTRGRPPTRAYTARGQGDRPDGRAPPTPHDDAPQ